MFGRLGYLPRQRQETASTNAYLHSGVKLVVLVSCLTLVMTGNMLACKQPWWTNSTNSWLASSPELPRGQVPQYCFVHITNRPISFDPKDQSLYQTSMYHVFDYTMRHGYHYFKVIDAAGKKDYLSGVWSKVKHVLRLVDDCHHVVLMDTDVFISNVTTPFPQMLDDWGYKNSTLVVGYTDPRACFRITNNFMSEYVCNDVERQVTENRQMNTGFLVFRRHHRVKQLLRYWYSCRDPVVNEWNASQVLQHCGSVRYERKYSLDQSVWNAVVRPEFKPGELVIVGCKYIGQGPFDPMCIGEHVQHRMYDKYKNATKGIMLRDMAGKFNGSERLMLLTKLVNGNHIRLWV